MKLHPCDLIYIVYYLRVERFVRRRHGLEYTTTTTKKEEDQDAVIARLVLFDATSLDLHQHAIVHAGVPPSHDVPRGVRVHV